MAVAVGRLGAAAAVAAILRRNQAAVEFDQGGRRLFGGIISFSIKELSAVVISQGRTTGLQLSWDDVFLCMPLGEI